MVWKKLGKLAEKGTDAAKGLGNTLNDAAKAGLGAANDLGKVGWQGAGYISKELRNATNTSAAFMKAVSNGAFDVVGHAAEGIYKAGSYAVQTADGYIGFSTFVGKTIELANGDYTDVRRSVAEGIRTNSSTVADGAVLAAQISSAVGFFPIAGWVVERYGKGAIEGGADYMSKLIRGGRVEYVGTEIIDPEGDKNFFGQEKDVLALMYMPENETSNRAGFAVMNEDALKAMAISFETGSHEANAFEMALDQVMREKVRLGLSEPSDEMAAEMQEQEAAGNPTGLSL